MDLFPKDYKRKEIETPVAEAKPSLASILAKVRARIAGLRSGGGGGTLAVSAQTKGALMKLGIVLSSAAFALVLVLWGSLAVYKNVLTNQVNELKKKQAEVFNDSDKSIATKIIGLEKTSVLVQGVFKSHVYTSGIFDKLAAVTVPRVQWRSFDLAVVDNRLNLKGFAADYATLAKQMMALSDGGFSNVVISNISMDKAGGVGFGATFNFDPKILQK